MRMYFIPRFLRFIYANKAIWKIPSRRKIIYLTFDDGPTSAITPWILDSLAQYNARATFFCVGDNVVKHAEIFNQITDRGHSVGNHSFHHLNGWKTRADKYLEDVLEAADVIPGKLFRPPYGRIRFSQSRLLNDLGYKIILWTVLSYDFDKHLDLETAWQKIVKHTSPGSIIVFHDHQKAFENLKELLPKTLKYYSKKGFVFEKISL